jgi:hypothetical protein
MRLGRPTDFDEALVRADPVVQLDPFDAASHPTPSPEWTVVDSSIPDVEMSIVDRVRESPTRQRRSQLLVAALAAVVALGLGATMVNRPDGDDGALATNLTQGGASATSGSTSLAGIDTNDESALTPSEPTIVSQGTSSTDALDQVTTTDGSPPDTSTPQQTEVLTTEDTRLSSDGPISSEMMQDFVDRHPGIVLGYHGTTSGWIASVGFGQLAEAEAALALSGYAGVTVSECPFTATDLGSETSRAVDFLFGRGLTFGLRFDSLTCALVADVGGITSEQAALLISEFEGFLIVNPAGEIGRL